MSRELGARKIVHCGCMECSLKLVHGELNFGSHFNKKGSINEPFLSEFHLQLNRLRNHPADHARCPYGNRCRFHVFPPAVSVSVSWLRLI